MYTFVVYMNSPNKVLQIFQTDHPWSVSDLSGQHFYVVSDTMGGFDRIGVSKYIFARFDTDLVQININPLKCLSPFKTT